MTQTIFFPLIDKYDAQVVKSAIDFTTRLAGLWEDMNARKLLGLAQALYALERMPKATEGIHIEYGISISNKRFWDIVISDDVFEVRSLGSLYKEKEDEFISTCFHFRVETSGYRIHQGSINAWEDEIHELLDDTYPELTVNNKSRLVNIDRVE